jgi:hypothetical protein
MAGATKSDVTMGLKAAVAALIAGAPMAAGAQDVMSAFGFEFGKPLQLQECPYHMIGNMKMPNEVIPKVTCVVDAQNSHMNEFGHALRSIHFSERDAPPFVYGLTALPLELNGNLVGISFMTLGVSAQSAVMDALTKKYGPPSSTSSRPVQTLGGARFDAVSALWVTPGVTVTFEEVEGRIDKGRVTIDLPAGSELRRKWAKESASAGRPL